MTLCSDALSYGMRKRLPCNDLSAYDSLEIAKRRRLDCNHSANFSQQQSVLFNSPWGRCKVVNQASTMVATYCPFNYSFPACCNGVSAISELQSSSIHLGNSWDSLKSVEGYTKSETVYQPAQPYAACSFPPMELIQPCLPAPSSMLHLMHHNIDSLSVVPTQLINASSVGDPFGEFNQLKCHSAFDAVSSSKNASGTIEYVFPAHCALQFSAHQYIIQQEQQQCGLQPIPGTLVNHCKEQNAEYWDQCYSSCSPCSHLILNCACSPQSERPPVGEQNDFTFSHPLVTPSSLADSLVYFLVPGSSVTVEVESQLKPSSTFDDQGQFFTLFPPQVVYQQEPKLIHPTSSSTEHKLSPKVHLSLPLEWILHCHKALGLQEQTTMHLACHLLQRATVAQQQAQFILSDYDFISLLLKSMPHLLPIVALWVAAKLEECRHIVPVVSKFSSVLRVNSGDLCELEFYMMQLLDWSPYKDFVT